MWGGLIGNSVIGSYFIKKKFLENQLPSLLIYYSKCDELHDGALGHHNLSLITGFWDDEFNRQ